MSTSEEKHHILVTVDADVITIQQTACILATSLQPSLNTQHYKQERLKILN